MKNILKDLSHEELIEIKKQLETSIASADKKQSALKILLNSLYGACANNYFRFFSTAIAEGITMTGQYIIQQVASDIDVYLNKVCETEGLKYVFYVDTDSNYLTLNTMANKFFPNAKGSDLIDILDTICKDKLSPVIAKSCVGIAEYQNAYKNTTEFKREVIADQAIFTVKKRYALNIWDSEGVRFAEPKLKIVGMESQRSSTPAWVRGKFKEAVKICLTGAELDLQSFIKVCDEEYKTLPVEKIAFPKGVNGLTKYSDSRTIYSKGCPIHVRASLLYNYLIKEHKLLKVYETIKEGDKLKYVYLVEPNTIRSNIIGWLSKMPLELDLHRYIDYTTMWEKTFLKPVESVLDAVGWSSYPKASLSAFY
jgi:DNA polymerase elongation subunit (family B)